jgi:hypothetical protein
MLGKVFFSKWWWHSGKTFASSSQGQGFDSSSCSLHHEGESVWEKFLLPWPEAVAQW